MDKQTKTYATWAVIVLIAILYFTIQSTLILFIGLAVLLVLGVAIETTETKD